MFRQLRRKDILTLEERFPDEIPKRDNTAEKIGRSYTRLEISKLEEARVPWLRRRRRS